MVRHPGSRPAALLAWGLALAGLAAFAARAGEEAPAAAPDVYAFAFDFAKPHHIYAVDEPIAVGVTMTKNGQPAANDRFRYVLEGEDALFGYVWKDTDAEGRATIETRLARPGFLRAYVFKTLDVPDPKNPARKLEYGARFGVAIAPADIRPARPRPADFDAYWDGVLAQLKALPFEAKVTPVEVTNANYADKVDQFDVQLNTIGDKPTIHGYLCLPKNAAPKSLPIVMNYQGADFRSANQTWRPASQGRLSFDINAHGLPNGEPLEFYRQAAKDNEPGFRIRGADNRDEFYFRNMIVRAARALQWLKTRPEWDGRTVIVFGGSQGGGQALAAAALDPDVTLCLAQVPTFCDNGGPLVGRDGGWPGVLRQLKANIKKENGGREPTAEELEPYARAIDYADNAFFAQRIGAKTEVLMSVGYFDFVCPPVGIYAAYNQLGTPNKRLIEDINTDHAVPQATHDAFQKALADHIAARRAP